MIKRFLDDNGRLKQFPAKAAVRMQVLAYLHTKFEKGRKYTEKEVNSIISQWITFGDYFIVRRSLVDNGLLARTSNGSEYWKIETPEIGR